MLNKLFSTLGKGRAPEKSVDTPQQKIDKKQKNADIYMTLSKYTSLVGKHFKIGLIPHIPERGVVLGLLSATAEKGGIALSLGKATTQDEELQSTIEGAKNPWYKNVNICGGLFLNEQTAGDHKINIALPALLCSEQEAGDNSTNVQLGAGGIAIQKAGDNSKNMQLGAGSGAIQEARDNSTNVQVGAGILAVQEAGDNSTNKQLGALFYTKP